MTFLLSTCAHTFSLLALQCLCSTMEAHSYLSDRPQVKAGTRFPAYDSSKAALFGLTRHVALEGAPRSIRANHVVPGAVDTPLGRVGDASVAGRSKIRWPLGRQATAWDIAYATVFMLSAESDYITAQSLAVDGGMTQFGNRSARGSVRRRTV